MPRYQYDEDIFKDSTMSFGEHLEELRRCLFRALLGLMVGFLVGLAVGRYVVEFIQTPLRAALEGYYEQKALADAQRQWEELQKQNLPLPTDLDAVKELVTKEHLLPEEVYVDREELLRGLEERYPQAKEVIRKILQDAAGASSTSEGAAKKNVGAEQAEETSADSAAAGSARQNLMRMFLWRRVAEDPRVQIKSFNVQEGFLIYVKASLLTGVILASPWIFYQLWIFI
ncbi:MAG TPA: twin-arginine translocase subunit TatC, partial [Thermoguttaceae bacterium]|nr:twin-arginine translocase subunit TatC [Thermoguttaceae bacterium]